MIDIAQTGIILLIALLFAVVFVFALRQAGPWGSFWSFFSILFLGIWAIIRWTPSVGPVQWGVAWIPLFFVGLIISLVLVATTPRGRQATQKEKPTDELKRKQRKQKRNMAMLNASFWILLCALLAIIVLSRILPSS